MVCWKFLSSMLSVKYHTMYMYNDIINLYHSLSKQIQQTTNWYVSNFSQKTEFDIQSKSAWNLKPYFLENKQK